MSAWKLQTDDKGSKTLAMDNNNQPIWDNDDGSSMSIDWTRASGTIKNLMAESKTKREANEVLTTKNTELTTQIETLKTNTNNDKNKNTNNNNDKDLQDSFNKKLEEMKTTFDGELLKKGAELENLLVGNKFASSKFISEKTILPSDLFQLKFGNKFKVVNGQVQAIGADGNALMSKKNLGEMAGFEEAIETIVDSYEYKDSILKGTQQSGGNINSSTKPSKNVYLSDLTTDSDKVNFQLKYGADEYRKLIQKGKRPQG